MAEYFLADDLKRYATRNGSRLSHKVKPDSQLKPTMFYAHESEFKLWILDNPLNNYLEEYASARRG